MFACALSGYSAPVGLKWLSFSGEFEPDSHWKLYPNYDLSVGQILGVSLPRKKLYFYLSPRKQPEKAKINASSVWPFPRAFVPCLFLFPSHEQQWRQLKEENAVPSIKRGRIYRIERIYKVFVAYWIHLYLTLPF